MKTASLLLIALLLCLAPCGAYAKKKGKGDHPAAAPASDPSNPAEALSPYIIHLDELLALSRPPKAAKEPLFTETTGLLTTLRQEFVVEQEKAPDDQKHMFTAAIGTADLITAALNDRQKMLGDLGASKAVKGSGKLEEQGRKDNIAQGIHGGGIGKAVAVAAERDREREANAKAKGRAVGNDKAMTAMTANEWNQRAIDWRQKISVAYGQIK